MTAMRRIVLLGKSGSGKSSLGNTILGNPDAFVVNHSPNSETRECRAFTSLIHGRNLTVVDTPGLFDTEAPSSSAFSPEIMQCLEACHPGPHSFLLVLTKGNFTAQERKVTELILKYFSPEALKYTTIVFTHGNDLPSGMRIEDWARQNDALSDFLQKCGNRCHVVDNMYWGDNRRSQNYRNNQDRVQDMLSTIDQVVIMNNESFFTNNLLPNTSMWQRFRDAPFGVQMAALLGVSVVGYLLFTTVPWVQVSQWVILGAKNGAAWVMQSLPAEEEIKNAIVYLAAVHKMFEEVQQIHGSAAESSSRCGLM